ncbi:hypothetical protein [Halalkalicoccus salilacus]|uniref:hypothetical protein n=1 Tax=Halalkalicoccus salilacus TaxID=3117459 RepID=UPI00300F0D5A
MTPDDPSRSEPTRGDSGDDAGDAPAPGPDDDRRDDVLNWLEDAMRESHRKVESGRMNDPNRERARQGWHQTLAKLANAYRLLARDQDLDRLADRIDAIEQQQGRDTDTDRFRFK